MKPVRLGINVDHVATIRQARRGMFPDPVEAAMIAEQAGADSIVCHLREDRRHIQDQDVRRLRSCVQTRLNLEMSIAEDIVQVALQVNPDQVTLVPERREELTTEGGLDVVRYASTLGPLVRRFEGSGIRVSIFIDPLEEQVRAVQEVGATVIELHTGHYADAQNDSELEREWERLQKASIFGESLSLEVVAGHGLDYLNVAKLLKIKQIEELNIGFSIVGQALFDGLSAAVRSMKLTMEEAASQRGVDV